MKINKKYTKEVNSELIEKEPIQETETNVTEYSFTEDFKNDLKSVFEEPEFNPVDGVVSGCTSLYVRSAAHANAAPIDVINGGTIVKIIGEEGDFWKLEKPEGFSMKKFIKIV